MIEILGRYAVEFGHLRKESTAALACPDSAILCSNHQYSCAKPRRGRGAQSSYYQRSLRQGTPAKMSFVENSPSATNAVNAPIAKKHTFRFIQCDFEQQPVSSVRIVFRG